jgi:uncharacterized protein YacL
MKNPQKTAAPVSAGKAAVVYALYAAAGIIFSSGVYFTILSLLNGITFRVINTDVSGVLLGILVAYLGFRYFLSVGKLKKEVFKTESVFSWSNFKRHKKQKSN